MNDLIAFLHARLDEDERMSLGFPPEWVALTMYPNRGEVVARPDGDPVARTFDHRIAEHFARWDPARVLAEVDARRRRLAVIADLDASADVDAGPATFELWRIEALPYAGHPDYREEWRL